jgi:nucleotide-binding universal stress UspA family protein
MSSSPLDPNNTSADATAPASPRQVAGSPVVVELERIVVGVDGSAEAAVAAAWAAALAHELGSQLTVASVWRPSRGELPKSEERAERDQARSVLEESWSEAARAVDPSCTSRLLEGVTPDALLDLADAIDAGLVVVGTRGRGGFAGLRLGSFSDWLAHRAVRPLAVVPTARRTGIRRMVIGLDGSDGWPSLVTLGTALAAPLGADVTAIHVLEPRRPWRSAPLERERTEALAALDNWTAYLRDCGVPVTTRLIEHRHPADALLAAADDVDADVVMISTRAFGEYRLLRLGGVTMQLVHHSDRPVIIVPPPEWAGDLRL